MFKSTINANGTPINLSLLLSSVAKSDLHWEMHRAQLHALDLLTYMQKTELELEAKENTLSVKVPVPEHLSHTLMGMEIVTHEYYPRSLIRLMHGDREVARIEHLGVPAAMGYSGPDYEADQKSEAKKFQDLTY